MLLGIDGTAAVVLEEPVRALGESAAAPGGLLLQPEQAVDAKGESVALPDGPHGRRRDANAAKEELAADANLAISGKLFGHILDALFQFLGRLVGHPRATPRLPRQPLTPYLSQQVAEISRSIAKFGL